MKYRNFFIDVILMQGDKNDRAEGCIYLGAVLLIVAAVCGLVKCYWPY